jgi:hypothetical protein
MSVWVINGHRSMSMSALPPKADMHQHGRDVRFVQIADIVTYSITSSARASTDGGTGD